MDTPIVLYWENFGPMHDDRALAVASAFPTRRVIGIEKLARSATYDWQPAATTGFQKITLFSGNNVPSVWRQFLALLRACRSVGRGDIFLCNYNELHVFLAAFCLRLLGARVHVMGDSKFDDYPRRLWREVLKSLYLLPYRSGLSSGRRGSDYLRLLGVRKVAGEYNTLSIERIRAAAGSPPAPAGLPFAERDFVSVARFVPKKNLSMLIDAYAIYCDLVQTPRRLVLCGSGLLEDQLRAKVKQYGIEGAVEFRGFVQIDEVSRILAKSLALLLPSIEEQFGNVVIEAQAMGLPVVVSDNVGARDTLVRNGVNGFVVEPDNPEGMAWFMARLSDEEALWTAMAQRASKSAHLGDVGRFVSGVRELLS